MNYYAAKELADSFRTVRKNTLIVIAQDLPQEKYAFRAAPAARSIGEFLAQYRPGTRLPD